MGLIRLQSGDHIGFVIKKNPASGMVKIIARNCELSGYFPEGTISEYIIYGKDYDGLSFSIEGAEEDKYLNALSYYSSVFVTMAISELFDTALKKTDPQDVPYNHVLIINALSLGTRATNQLTKLLEYFTDITLEVTEEEQYIFKANNTTLNYFLNVIVVVMTVTSILSNEKFDVSGSMIDKIVNCMVRCNAPYFVRYYFVSRMANPADFNRCKKLLETHPTKKIKMVYGSTLHQRMTALEKQLSFEIPIVDVGCGEGNYLLPFSQKLKLKNKRYIGFDIDEDELEKCRIKIENKELGNAIVTSDINELFAEASKCGEVELLITEVIEHMELSEVAPFIQNILNNINFSKLLITTPNHDFNVNYIMENKFRHYDHKWELGKNEFQQLMSSINLPNGYSMSFFDIGDSVDDVCCTLGCKIVRV